MHDCLSPVPFSSKAGVPGPHLGCCHPPSPILSCFPFDDPSFVSKRSFQAGRVKTDLWWGPRHLPAPMTCSGVFWRASALHLPIRPHTSCMLPASLDGETRRSELISRYYVHSILCFLMTLMNKFEFRFCLGLETDGEELQKRCIGRQVTRRCHNTIINDSKGHSSFVVLSFHFIQTSVH